MVAILLSCSLTAVNAFHVFHDTKKICWDRNFSTKEFMVKIIAGIALSTAGWIFFGSLGSAAGMLIGYELATCYQFLSKKIISILDQRKILKAINPK